MKQATSTATSVTKQERFKVIPAVYLVLRRDNEILLLKRRNTGYEDGNYGLVSGHIDGGERAEEAMMREAHEEAGIDIEVEDLKFVHAWHRLSHDHNNERIDLGFECVKWSGEIRNMEPEKCAELAWFPIDNLPENTIPYVRKVLQLIENGVTYSSYGKDEQI